MILISGAIKTLFNELMYVHLDACFYILPDFCGCYIYTYRQFVLLKKKKIYQNLSILTGNSDFKQIPFVE